MVMKDAVWERHDISRKRKIHDPVTGKSVERNPFALRPDVPERFRMFTIDGFLEGGGIVLACNYAFGLMVQLEAQKAKLEMKAARDVALGSLLRGVILQPSGFFAVLEAERAGCHFFPASS